MAERPPASDKVDEWLHQQFYPGSRHRIPDRRSELEKPEEEWDSRPVKLVVDGEPREFFTIGMLAKALQRSAITLREWEVRGILPQANYRKAAINPAKNTRLYTRAQVEGIVAVAWEHGLMRQAKAGGLLRGRIPQGFVDRVHELFQEAP